MSKSNGVYDSGGDKDVSAADCNIKGRILPFPVGEQHDEGVDDVVIRTTRKKE